MSNDKITEKINDKGFTDETELLIDSPSSSLKLKKTKNKNKKTKNKKYILKETKKVNKSIKERYLDMIKGKSFDIRKNGNTVYTSSSSSKSFKFEDSYILIDGLEYKYNEIVIRIKY